MKWAVVVFAVLSAVLGFALQSERLAHANTQKNAIHVMAQLHEQANVAEAANRKIEKELSDAAINHSTQVDRLLADQRRAAGLHAVDGKRLRDEAIAFARRDECVNPAASGNVEAGNSAAVVLAELLGRAESRATELARTADEARTRGLACEADYDRARMRD